MHKDEFRVTDWNAFIGQSALKTRLYTHIEAAKLRHRALPHVLLSGPPGFGKTSLAAIVANELGVSFDEFVCPITERTLYNIVIGEYGDLILLDEIHRMKKSDQERLLSIVEDGVMHCTTGAVVPVEESLTLVAATTERDKVIAPLFDRFIIKPEFENYADDELEQIVGNMSKAVNVALSDEMVKKFGIACAGVPRNARQLISATRDFRLAYGREPAVREVLELCQIDNYGLTVLHLRYLDYLRRNGASGLSPLATILNVPQGAVVAMERTLLRNGLIRFTKQGRELTVKGAKYGRTGGSRP